MPRPDDPHYRWPREYECRQNRRRLRNLCRADNGYNPLVIEDCPRCQAAGRVAQTVGEGKRAETTVTPCPDCCGKGNTGQLVPFFRPDLPPIEVAPFADGWFYCPSVATEFM